MTESPVATVLSAAMMLRWLADRNSDRDLRDDAQRIEQPGLDEIGIRGGNVDVQLVAEQRAQVANEGCLHSALLWKSCRSRGRSTLPLALRGSVSYACQRDGIM